MNQLLHVINKLGAGELAIMPMPMPGEAAEKEIAMLATLGYGRVISLLEPDEAERFGMGREGEFCQKHGIQFETFPVKDRGVPESVQSFAEFAKKVAGSTRGGTNTVIHCLGGIGRSGTLAAAILLHFGYSPERAFEYISQKRGVQVPNSDEQYHWLIRHQDEIKAALSPNNL